jgi:hypothetical protein
VTHKNFFFFRICEKEEQNNSCGLNGREKKVGLIVGLTLLRKKIRFFRLGEIKVKNYKNHEGLGTQTKL